MALYRGEISPDLYRDTLTVNLGAGTSNKASFDCIIAHLPRGGAGPAPSK